MEEERFQRHLQGWTAGEVTTKCATDKHKVQWETTYDRRSNGKHRVLASPEDDFDLRTPLAEHINTIPPQAPPQRSTVMSNQTQQSNQQTNNGCCSAAQPPALFLLGTLAMTAIGTALLCAAIMTDHWEHITWDKDSLEYLTNGSIHWLLDGSVARLGRRGSRLQTSGAVSGGAFLVPMHGGIWTLCVSLSEHETRLLSRIGYPRNKTCDNYLAGGLEDKTDGRYEGKMDGKLDLARGDEPRADWQHRMQNLSISCALVCLIILGSAALVGAFGVCQRQVSAVLVTGVMYLLAALFALFTLMIIHFKRQQGKPTLDENNDGTVDGVVGGTKSEVLGLMGARIFSTAWSLDLGWGGVAICAITSFLWILLSKIMIYNPITAML